MDLTQKKIMDLNLYNFDFNVQIDEY